MSAPRTDSRLLVALLAVPQGLLGAAAVYLLALLAAAAARGDGDRVAAAGGPLRRFAILVPAHDEEAGLAATLDTLARLDYPADRCEVVVVADNCTDGTAAVARGRGVRVLERRDSARRGKGPALAWALERLADDPDPPDAVAMVDADCRVSPDLLRAFDAHLAAGGVAVQCRYGVANPEAAPAAALRWAGFALVNLLRPLGRDALGLSAGLYGSGMAFDAALLRRRPWDAFSITEDAEYHLRLVADGERVAFAPRASVVSAMPTSLAASDGQQRRWEGGRLALARTWAPRLARDGLRRRDPGRLHAAVDLLVPAQSVLVGANLAVGAVALLGRSRPALRRSLAIGVAQATFVLGGLAVVRAPAAVWRALPRAPRLIARKLWLLAGLARHGGPRSWERTPRERS